MKAPRVNSKLNWLVIDNFLFLSTWKLGDLIIGMKKGDEKKYVLAQRLRLNTVPGMRIVTKVRGEFDSLDLAVQFADAYLTSKLGYNGVAPMQRFAPWLSKPASESQLKYLKKLGFTPKEGQELKQGTAQLMFAVKALKSFRDLDPLLEDLYKRPRPSSSSTPKDSMLMNAIIDEARMRAQLGEDDDDEEK